MKQSYKSKKIIAAVLATAVALSTHTVLALEKQEKGVLATQEASQVEKPSLQTAITDPTTTSSPEAVTASDQVEIQQLSLEDALKAAETGNPTFKLLDSKLAILERQNTQARLRKTENIPVDDIVTRKDRDLNHLRAQWTLDNAKHDREVQLKALKVEITNQYRNILLLQQQDENFKVQLQNLDTSIEQLNLQIGLGLRVPADLYTYTAQRSKLVAGQKANQNAIVFAMNTLKKDLGIDINRPIKLTSSQVSHAKFDDKDIEDRIAQAIEKDYDKQRYQRDIEITEIEYNIDFFYNDPAADSVQLSIEDKKATLENLAVNKELSLRTAYNALKVLENAVEADRLTIEADQIAIDLLQKNIDVGRSTTLELIPLQNKLMSSQYTLQQDINAYAAAVTNFENSLTNF